MKAPKEALAVKLKASPFWNSSLVPGMIGEIIDMSDLSGGYAVIAFPQHADPLAEKVSWDSSRGYYFDSSDLELLEPLTDVAAEALNIAWVKW